MKEMQRLRQNIQEMETIERLILQRKNAQYAQTLAYIQKAKHILLKIEREAGYQEATARQLVSCQMY